MERQASGKKSGLRDNPRPKTPSRIGPIRHKALAPSRTSYARRGSSRGQPRPRTRDMQVIYPTCLQLSGPETVAGTLSGAPPTETGPTDFGCRAIRLRIAADSP
jgi:hypothetical protein